MDFSRLMLGTVQFGLNYGIANTAGKPSYETVRQIIQTAVANGVTSLDTAASYGDSEVVLGQVLAELQLRDRVTIISKVPPISGHNLTRPEAKKFIIESVENSLRRLGVAKLAGCLFHVESDWPYLDLLQGVEQRGLIGGAGISLDSNQYCEPVLTSGAKFVQLPYNIFDRRYDAFLAAAPQHGIKVFTRSVYLQGLLLMPEDRIADHLRSVIPVRRQLAQLAESAGITLSELCMRYVLSHPSVTSVLTGVDNAEQLHQNLELARRGPLDIALCRQIRELVPFFEERIIRPFLWPKK